MGVAYLVPYLCGGGECSMLSALCLRAGAGAEEELSEGGGAVGAEA